MVKNEAIKKLLYEKFCNQESINQLKKNFEEIKKENKTLKKIISKIQENIKNGIEIPEQHENIYQTYQKGSDQKSSSTLGDVKDIDSDS